MARTMRFLTLSGFVANLPNLLAESETRRLSLIVRVGGNGVIQIDDCDARTIEALRPLSFLQIETSRGNYQSWLAVKGAHGLNEVRRRLFTGLRAQGMTGNGGSYGALRWPGSTNFKSERCGPDGPPRVQIVMTQARRRIVIAELEQIGLWPELPISVPRPVISARSFGGRHKWPDYDKCLRDAHLRHPKKESVRSEADAQFVYISLKRGFSESEIAAMLPLVSVKAEKEGQRYIRRTIDIVARWTERGRGPER
jgi:hypothetical protein